MSRRGGTPGRNAAMSSDEVFDKVTGLVVDMADAIALIVQTADQKEIENDLSIMFRQIIRVRIIISDRSQLLEGWDAAPALLAARACAQVLDLIVSIQPNLCVDIAYGDMTISEELEKAVKLETRLERAAGPAGEVISVMTT